jgi:hypothetical protein
VEDLRQAACAGCKAIFYVCRRCDRGQIYRRAEHAQDLQVRAAAMTRAATKAQLRQRRTRKLAESESAPDLNFPTPFAARTRAIERERSERPSRQRMSAMEAKTADLKVANVAR